MSDAVTDKILEIIVREGRLRDTNLSRSDKLQELEIDSIDMVSIYFGLEEEFDISIPEDESLKTATVQDVIDRLQQIIGEKEAYSP